MIKKAWLHTIVDTPFFCYNQVLKMRKITLLFFAAFLGISTALAVPAKKVKKQMLRADGTSVEVTLCGDEHFSFYKDEAGLPYTLNGVGRLQPTTDQLVAETWENMRVSRLQRAGISHSPAKSPRKVGEPHTTVGKVRGLVLLVQFPDVPFVTENPKAVFNRFFNEKNYNEYGMSHSVTDYFSMQSYGKLEIDFDVVGPFTTKHEMAYYGAPSGSANDVNPAGMVSEAIDAAAPEVDFTPYDWDEDGEVDQVFVIYAGYNQAQGAESNTIWPHEWNLDAAGLRKNYNDKIIRTYGCTSELRGDGKRNTGILDGIGTACHEFSHCLGLPDMYDTGNAGNFGMNTWDIMDYGSYNGDNCVPAGYTAYERMFSGWLTPVELNTMTTITDMKPLAEAPECYILYNDAHRTEYYLLENRQKVGTDTGLLGHGLLVLHVDYNKNMWSKNKINIDPDHQRVTIIPADNEAVATAKSLAGDPFPGATRNTALANYSSPASALYNPNTDGSYYMNKPIDSITESEEGLISFVALRPEMLAPEWAEATEVKGEPSVNITWATVKDAVSYQVELIENYTAQPADSLLCEFDLAQTQAESLVYTDISSKMSDYGLPGWSGSNLFASPGKLLIGSTEYAGEVKTSKWQVPSSRNITVVMGVGMVDENPFNCKTYIWHHKNGDNTTYAEGFGTNIYSEGKYLFNFTDIPGDDFYINIKPGYQMNLNYLAAYDGTWTENELGLGADGSTGKAIALSTVYNTEANSITINDLNPEHMYIYRVRAIGSDDFSSNWTAKQSFQFDNSGISSMLITPRAGKIYDLQGRPRGTDPSALPKGIYIIGGRKVVK